MIEVVQSEIHRTAVAMRTESRNKSKETLLKYLFT